jgi:hypothetical protein
MTGVDARNSFADAGLSNGQAGVSEDIDGGVGLAHLAWSSVDAG